MRRLPLLLALFLLPALGQAACPPAGRSPEQLQALKAAEFAISDAGERNALALALLDCLADPDPMLRDGIAFEAYFTWLRAEALSAETRAVLRDRLLAWIGPQGADDAGFRQPFAALVMAEVVRSDRVAAWMTADEREAIVAAAADYLSGVRDYRGFIEGEGWRHGVAHGADLALQLALNPNIGQAQLDRLLAAIAVQVAPAAGHAYIHGESRRLATATIYIALRGLHTPEQWQAWLAGLATPAPHASWREAMTHLDGLARRHNASAFLLAIYATALEADSPALKALLPAVRDAMKAMP